MRLSDEVAHRSAHRLQPLSNLISWPGFTAAIDVHATGLIDVYTPGRKAELLKDRNWRAIWCAHRAALGKLLRYYGRDYVFSPMLTGPFFSGRHFSETSCPKWARTSMQARPSMADTSGAHGHDCGHS